MTTTDSPPRLHGGLPCLAAPPAQPLDHRTVVAICAADDLMAAFLSGPAIAAGLTPPPTASTLLLLRCMRASLALVTAGGDCAPFVFRSYYSKRWLSVELDDDRGPLDMGDDAKAMAGWMVDWLEHN